MCKWRTIANLLIQKKKEFTEKMLLDLYFHLFILLSLLFILLVILKEFILKKSFSSKLFVNIYKRKHNIRPINNRILYKLSSQKKFSSKSLFIAHFC
jgi:hypothetical protein